MKLFLTTEQAREYKKLGYTVTFLKMYSNKKDLYLVEMIKNENITKNKENTKKHKTLDKKKHKNNKE